MSFQKVNAIFFFYCLCNPFDRFDTQVADAFDMTGDTIMKQYVYKDCVRALFASVRGSSYAIDIKST